MEQIQLPIRLKKKRKVVGLDYCISIFLYKLAIMLFNDSPHWTSYGDFSHILTSQGFDANIKNKVFTSHDMGEIYLTLRPTGEKYVNIKLKLISVYRNGPEQKTHLIWQPLEGKVELPNEQPMDFTINYIDRWGIDYEIKPKV